MLSIAKTATMMAGLSVVSKVLGFIREMVLAGFYGTSEITDIYVLANTIPTYMLGSFFLAIAAVYMPLLAEHNITGDTEKFTNKVISLLISISLISVLLGMMLSDKLVVLFGYKGHSAEIAVKFCRISFCYVIFSSVVNIQASYLQFRNIFLPQVVAGYMVSIGCIVFTIVSAKISVYLLPLGYMAGYFGQMCVQAFATRQIGYRYRPDFRLKETVKRILVLAPMVFIGSMVTYINGFVDKLFAASLAEGSVSALNYGNLIQNMIMTLTITVITTIIYPHLTRAAASGEMDVYENVLKKGIMLILIITIPFTFGIIAFHGEVVQVVYERGAFGTGSTDMTSIAFLYYGIGLVFISLNQLIIQAYYSLKNMKTSVWCGMLGVAVNIALDFILVKHMAHGGLALATSIAAMVNTVSMIYFYRKKYPDIKLVQSGRKVILIVFSAAVSVLLAYGVYHGLVAAVWMPRICYLFVAMAAAGLCYLVLLWKCGIEELQMLKRIIK